MPSNTLSSSVSTELHGLNASVRLMVSSLSHCTVTACGCVYAQLHTTTTIHVVLTVNSNCKLLERVELLQFAQNKLSHLPQYLSVIEQVWYL
jgi:hypothetical protein